MLPLLVAHTTIVRPSTESYAELIEPEDAPLRRVTELPTETEVPDTDKARAEVTVKLLLA
jgi:hypothetical protein